jgi:hypothetical protein
METTLLSLRVQNVLTIWLMAGVLFLVWGAVGKGYSMWGTPNG